MKLHSRWIWIDNRLISDVRVKDMFGTPEQDDWCAYLLFYWHGWACRVDQKCEGGLGMEHGACMMMGLMVTWTADPFLFLCSACRTYLLTSHCMFLSLLFIFLEGFWSHQDQYISSVKCWMLKHWAKIVGTVKGSIWIGNSAPIILVAHFLWVVFCYEGITRRGWVGTFSSKCGARDRQCTHL